MCQYFLLSKQLRTKIQAKIEKYTWKRREDCFSPRPYHKFLHHRMPQTIFAQTGKKSKEKNWINVLDRNLEQTNIMYTFIDQTKFLSTKKQLVCHLQTANSHAYTQAKTLFKRVLWTNPLFCKMWSKYTGLTILHNVIGYLGCPCRSRSIPLGGLLIFD